jgi:hypothetical protein
MQNYFRSSLIGTGLNRIKSDEEIATDCIGAAYTRQYLMLVQFYGRKKNKKETVVQIFKTWWQIEVIWTLGI